MCIKCECQCEFARRHRVSCRGVDDACIGCRAYDPPELDDDIRDEVEDLNALDHSFRAGESARMRD